MFEMKTRDDERAYISYCHNLIREMNRERILAEAQKQEKYRRRDRKLDILVDDEYIKARGW